jgi:Xaa-Pro aminopeptidase
MTMEARLAQLRELTQSAGLDGWLLYDFKGLNPFPAQLLGLGDAMLTRRWFLYVPAQGRPTLIHHYIEASTWQQLLPGPGVTRALFSAHEELDARLRQALAGARRIAMEYSPRGDVPYVSRVDAGTLERVRAFGVEVVSSADLLQHFQVWSDEDLQQHLEAVRGVIGAKDAGFALIDERLRAGQPVTELEVQDLLVRHITAAGLEFDHPPIVAFGAHASDGHYAPSAQTDCALAPGTCVLLDLWAGFKDRPMADITWVGFAGAPTDEYLRVWDAVRGGRDAAIQALTSGAATEGWQADRAARDLIAARGYGDAFRHRLGHSLGRNNPHGLAVNLDDLETHDTRKLLPGLAVTVEPGVYLGHLGVRSEVNVLITASGATVTTPLQDAPYRLGIA